MTHPVWSRAFAFVDCVTRLAVPLRTAPSLRLRFQRFSSTARTISSPAIRAATVATAAVLSLQAADKVDFAKEVKPIFDKSCAGCHGAKMQMAKLRLDSKASAARTWTAGHPEESSLYQRVAGLGETARMPMGGKPLPPEQIDVIKRWIAEGAVWPDTLSTDGPQKKHWAFIPPVRPALPQVSNADWAKSPVDAFILARLDREGLKPSPAAEKTAQLRRVYLDLIGLPPTPKQVDDYLADKRPGAYERVVDQLLASPHYGERWGRHWLDAARYADSDGFEKDKQRFVWFYRDWVIQSINRDLPYNEFIVDQLAGDLLPNPTQDQMVATGFLRNSMVNEEGGIEPEQFRMEAMFDRMDAVGKAMLGVTIQCAQCHNHKFDPLTQEEYYKLFAYLNDSYEGSVAVYTPTEQARRAEILRQVRATEMELKHRMPDWPQRFEAWASQLKAKDGIWKPVVPAVDDISTGGQRYVAAQENSMLAAGYAPTQHTVKLTLKTDLPKVSAFRLELLNDPDLPLGGPGRSIKGTAALTEFEVEVNGKKLKIAKATADINLPERPIDEIYRDKDELAGKKAPRVTGPIAYAIDGNKLTAWGIDAGPVLRNQPRQAVFVLETPIENAKEIVVYLSQRHGGWNSDDNQNYNLGRFRLSVTDAGDAEAHPAPTFSAWRETIPEWKTANEKIAGLWHDHPEGTSQLVLQSREQMRETHILNRGNFLQPGRVVQPGVPSFLNAIPEGAPANRLTLARWITDRQAPTTSRAFVNRVWQAYFGTGLVATSEDFGRQAETPSHPELLDWLAVEFMDSGWSMKKLHRVIVTSNTYRQTSNVTPELLQKDPYNRLLARGPRFRVEGEIVRDIALSASGLLNEKVGGPSVYPPAPDFLFQPPASYGPKVWNEAHDAERYRRAIYTFRYRSVPYPMLQNFDTPNADIACVRRARSNTPLQALTTLNEPLFVEAAQALAAKTLKEGGTSDAERVTYAFRRCLSRPPDSAEQAELLSFLAKQKSRPNVDAWTSLARVILNLDETITKE